MRVTPRVFVVGSRQIGLSGPADCHVYLIRSSEGYVLIDAGGGGTGERIAANIRQEGIDPSDVRALLLTHSHADHACGAAELRSLTGCKVYISDHSRKLLEQGTDQDAGLDVAREQGVYPPDFHYRNCVVDHGLRDRDVIEIGDLRFQAIAVEGHSPDSLCFSVEIDGARHLFSGDVLFYGGILGLINFPGSTMDGYRRDLPKLRGLGIDGLFPGHLLFTISGGQQHIDAAIDRCRRGEIPQSIGQHGYVF